MTEHLGDILKPVRQNLLDENEWHDIKHENALNETEAIQQQITQLWDAVVELRKDVEKLMGIWNFGQRMSDTSGMHVIKADDEGTK